MSRAGVLIGAPAFSILRYGHLLIVRVIMMFLSEAWCPSMGGKDKEESGTSVLTVFLQHICSEVNTSKGVLEALRCDSRSSPINGK